MLQSAIDQGLDALDCGEEEAALERLVPLAGRHGESAKAWQVVGLLYRALEESRLALDALDRAARLAPADSLIANARAQVLLEAGLDAVPAFEACLRMAPSAQVIQGLAAALVAQGRRGDAVALLDATLVQNPGWAEGHWLLGRLRGFAGERDRALSSIDRALQAAPRDAALWQMRLAIQQRSLDFAGILEVSGRARAAIGEQRFILAAEAAAASETGQMLRAEPAFARLGAPTDITEAVYQARHLLRSGRPVEASALAEPLAEQAGPHLWPYLACAWRMTGDSRWDWLEGQEGLVRPYDISEDLGDLGAIAERLRQLHASCGEPLEQSVRGGTQTDGPLLARMEPEIRQLRTAITKAVRRHIDALPPIDPGHPQLRQPRDRRIAFAGAWSVRLVGGGHHVSHIHPEGWFSSALYLSLPPDLASGESDDRSGWLAIGEPEPVLGTGLPALQDFRPKLGTLVLFPSTMWHGTRPFGEGERMTVAFDVAPPIGH